MPTPAVQTEKARTEAIAVFLAGFPRETPKPLSSDPLTDFLCDAEAFDDASADAMLSPTWDKAVWRKSSDAIRYQLHAIVEARANGMSDQLACKRLADILIANVQHHVQRTK